MPKSKARARVPESMQVKKTNPNMMMVKTYVVMLVVNAVVLFVANMLFPMQIVLGTISLSPLWSILLSMGALALIDTLILPFAHEIEKRLGRVLTSWEWMLKYFIVNLVALWLITHASQQFGLGVTSVWVSVVLAVVLDVVQGMVMMSMGKMMDAKK
jgi:uncharacterized membrane protein YbhN (UPF0104 family)